MNGVTDYLDKFQCDDNTTSSTADQYRSYLIVNGICYCSSGRNPRAEVRSWSSSKARMCAGRLVRTHKTKRRPVSTISAPVSTISIPFLFHSFYLFFRTCSQDSFMIYFLDRLQASEQKVVCIREGKTVSSKGGNSKDRRREWCLRGGFLVATFSY